MYKKIVITGASSDLGSALVREISRESDVQIIATMRRRRRVDEDLGGRVTVLDGCDLTVPECCAELAEVVGRKFDGPFGLVHSVGEFWEHIPFMESGPQLALQTFESHVTTLYCVLQALIPLMQVRGGGSCVAFSCQSVKYNYPWMAAYTASKAAVESLVRSLANEFSTQGIRLNALVLASLKTEKVHISKPKGDFAHFTSPDDIAPIVRFLLSEESRLINGSSISLFEPSSRFFHEGYFERVSK